MHTEKQARKERAQQWQLIFIYDDGTSPQVFICEKDDYQESVRSILTEHDGLIFVAAVCGADEIHLRDDSRSTEGGVQRE